MRLASYLDSKQSRKAADLIIKKGRTLGCALYVVGWVFLMILPNENVSKKSFFDENALMAGLVKREFTDSASISHYAGRLRGGGDVHTYMELVEAEFIALGLEVYSQNFSALKPVALTSEGPLVKGRNVYAILRAGRAKSTESIVLAAPHHLGDYGGDNVHGASIMLALAKYFKTKNYWAKDLIFLVTSCGEVGMQAWVDQYMGLTKSGKFGITSSSLPGRSGAIQAVINLEIPSASIRHVNVIIEGINGILPNLDLVNVVVYLCHTERINIAFHDSWEWLSPSWLLDANHQHSLYNAVAMVMHQASGLPKGGHAHFLKHRIDSLTVRGVASTDRKGSSKELLGVARALEGSFRSINNLLETLHHSEFFYFTSSHWKFVSIGLYLPSIALLLAPVVMEALSQWLLARPPPSSQSCDSHTMPRPSFPFQAVIHLVLFCYGCGLLLYCTVLFLSHASSPLTANTLLLAHLIPMGLAALAPLAWRSKVDDSSWRIGKFFSLILSLVTLIALCMLNFSLAIIVSLMLTSSIVLAQPYSSQRDKVLFYGFRLFLLLSFSPPSFLILFFSGYLYFFVPASIPFPWLIMEGASLSLEGVATALTSWMFHECWLFPVCCLGVWPLWLTSWTLSCSRVETKKEHLE